MGTNSEKNKLVSAITRELYLLDAPQLAVILETIEQFKAKERERALAAASPQPVPERGLEAKLAAEERRRFKRLKASLPVKYSVVGGEEDPLEGVSKDISSGGARLVLFSRYQIEPGFILEIDILLPSRMRPVTTRAKVAWVKDCRDNNGARGYESGLTFIDILTADKQEIEQFVSQYANGSPGV